ncbi:MAG TPA: metal ABC transporter substrate-binding protein [Dehalococcoidales bacterium]|nr:metal ABC transporter substrate-binding protein [Dehalococcoidales bacterium]
MKKFILCAIAISLIVLAAGAISCRYATTSKMKVVASTSLISYIVEQVGGKYVDVIDLVPPNQHPGNFDAAPAEIQTLATAKLFITHGWPGEDFDQLISSANNPNLTVVKANVDGNWMIPEVQSAAADRVADILGEADRTNAEAYIKAANDYKTRINTVESEVKEKLQNAHASKVNVIASVRQADFLQWAGFNVVGTFQDAQSLTPKVVQDLIDRGKANNVLLVVNNIQDGQDAGKAIAAELGVANINLSNFPGGLQNTETWEKAIQKNVQLLTEALP